MQEKEIIKSDEAFQLVGKWMKAYGGENRFDDATSDKPSTMELRPPRLGLGAKSGPHPKTHPSMNSLERKLRSKIQQPSEFTRTQHSNSKAANLGNPKVKSNGKGGGGGRPIRSDQTIQNGDDGSSSDDDEGSRSKAFSKKRKMGK